MEVTILGTSAAFPTPKRACSSYLITEGRTNLLLDLGAGSFSNLTVYARPERLDALIITHLHQDHFLDLFPLYYYLKYEAKPEKKLRVYAPSSSQARLGCLLGTDGELKLGEVFEFSNIEEGAIALDRLSIEFARVKHIEPTFGVAVSVGGKKLAYSSDSGYSPSLVTLAAGADLFICEATLMEPVSGLDHLTAEESGRIASEASARRLMLTHIWPSIDPENSRLMAEEHFVGEVALAEEGEKSLI